VGSGRWRRDWAVRRRRVRTWWPGAGRPADQQLTRLAQRFWLHRDLDNRDHNRNVVNVSSLSASRVYPGGQAVYAASKAALNQLSRHLAAEFGVFGVRVNALAPNNFPSVVRTESVASAIARLDGESVTGRVLVLDVAEQSSASVG
jgi:NAD(P)-dependent dehydrogenase (short-subunit alcohol dehydrogenase family)